MTSYSPTLSERSVAVGAIRWPVMIPAIFATAFLPLTVHVLMLNAGIPHPAPIVDRSLVAWSNDLFTAAGTLIVFRSLGAGLRARPITLQALVVLLLVAALSGQVFRDAFMDVYIVVAPLFSLSTVGLLVDNYRPVLPLALIVVLAATVARHAIGGGRIGIASLLTGSLVWFLIVFCVDPALNPLVASLDAHEGRPFELPPYDARVEIPAYATYLEPAVASIALVSLIWDRLPGQRLGRIGASAGIVFLLIGPVARPFIDSLTGLGFRDGFLGPLQFSLESLALGASAGVARMFGVRRPAA